VEVDSHPQSPDTVNGSDLALRVPSDALLINTGLHPALLEAGLELLDDGTAQFAGHIVESASNYGCCGIVCHEKKKGGEARVWASPLRMIRWCS